jgi:hypothetical protein
MKALCLFGVLVAAKVMVVEPGVLVSSVWAPIAYFSPDALVAVAAAAIDILLRRRRLGWWIYGAAVAMVAIEAPVAAVLGSPMTLPMMRASRGPIADSVVYYATWSNILRSAAIAALGVTLPIVLTRMVRPEGEVGRNGTRFSIAVSLAMLALAPTAASYVDTEGRDRNAFTALMPLRLPTMAAAAAPINWRASPIPGASPAQNLTRYRGVARNMNVLIVILESTGARYLRPYGADDDPTPNLTRLAGRALIVDDAYAVYPESIKGLLATLCSMNPVFGESVERLALLPCDSIASALRADAYRTALFHSGRFAYLGMEAVVANRGFDSLEDAGVIGGQIRSSFGVDEPATVARILAWIDGLKSSDRFFVSYLPIAGHHPYVTPEPGPYAGSDDESRYKNALHYADASLGALLEGLRRRGLADHTVVVVFGDHGEAFGRHRGNVGHVLRIDEENVRVPYVIAIPGITSSAIHVQGTASVIDTAPTILDLLDLPASPRHQGTSLLQPGARMSLFLTDYALGWIGLRDGCWKFQLDVSAGRSNLFDLCHDAGETTDLADQQPRRVDAYRTRALQWSAAQAAATRNGRAP